MRAIVAAPPSRPQAPPPALAQAVAQRFVGRHGFLRAVEDVLETGARLVTLVGPAGSGKSWAAQRLAGTRWRWCALDGIKDAGRARRAITAALRGAPTGTIAVLDDVDGLHAEAGDLLDALHAANPDVRWLVTCRRPLRLHGERSLETPPFSVDEAAALYALVQGRPPSPGHMEVLCRRVGGLPLALELCAQHSVLSVEALLSEDGTLLDGLHNAWRDVPERHRSLRACVEDWLGGIQADSRSLLRALSLFARGFDAEDAARVTGTPPVTMVAALQELREHHLLLDEDPGRLELHPCVHLAAARDLLNDPGRDALTRAHALGVLGRCEPLVLLDDGRVEHSTAPEVRLPLQRWEADLWAIVERMGDGAPELSVRAALVLNPLLTMQGRLEQHTQLMERCVAWARRAGQSRLLAMALFARSMLLAFRGRVAQAQQDASESLALRQSDGDAHGQAVALWMLGHTSWKLGRLAEGAAHARELLALARAHGMRFYEGNALLTLGRIHASAGEHQEAMVVLEQAQALFRSLRTQRQLVLSYLNLAQVLVRDGQVARARVQLEHGLLVAEPLQDGPLQLRVMVHLSGVHRALAEPAQAEALCRRALERARAFDDHESLVLIHLELAELALDRGDSADALDQVGPAKHLLLMMDRPELHHRALDVEARVHLLRGDGVRAQGLLDEARAITMRTHRALPAGTRPVLRVTHDGRRFQLADAAPVNLSRRGALRRILVRLVTARQLQPGVGLSWSSLLESGWPGEKVLPHAGAQRVYTAIRQLRRMGLQHCVVTDAEGYLLSTSVDVQPDAAA